MDERGCVYPSILLYLSTWHSENMILRWPDTFRSGNNLFVMKDLLFWKSTCTKNGETAPGSRVHHTSARIDGKKSFVGHQSSAFRALDWMNCAKYPKYRVVRVL